MFSFLKKFLGPREKVFFSPVNGQIKIRHSYGHLSLLVEGTPQSGGEFVFMWKKLLQGLKSQKQKLSSALVLGVGGGTVIQMIKKFFPQAKILGVEIDRVMVEIAQKFFGLEKISGLKIETADAFLWAKKRRREKFDFIVVDLFCRELNPPFARRKNFLFALRRLLKKGGVIFYNSHFQGRNPEEFKNFQKLCRQLFPLAEEVFSYPKNKVLKLSN